MGWKTHELQLSLRFLPGPLVQQNSGERIYESSIFSVDNVQVCIVRKVVCMTMTLFPSRHF